MMKVGLIFTFMLFFSVTIFPQMASIPYQYLSNPRYDVGNQDQILEELQAAFIQEIFVKELFSKPPTIEIDDDEDMYDLSASNDLMDSIFAREISKMLAKQDLLKLSEYRFE